MMTMPKLNNNEVHKQAQMSQQLKEVQNALQTSIIGSKTGPTRPFATAKLSRILFLRQLTYT